MIGLLVSRIRTGAYKRSPVGRALARRHDANRACRCGVGGVVLKHDLRVGRSVVSVEAVEVKGASAVGGGLGGGGGGGGGAVQQQDQSAS